MSDERTPTDDPVAGTVDDPNVEDPYAELRAKNEAAAAVARNDATDDDGGYLPVGDPDAADTDADTSPDADGLTGAL